MALSQRRPIDMAGVIVEDSITAVSCPAIFAVHVVQFQPTSRPIEDAYSITDGPGDQLLIGVFDGMITDIIAKLCRFMVLLSCRPRRI